MIRILKKYKIFLIVLIINLILLLLKWNVGLKSFVISAGNLREMLIIMPPIFILLGLLDTWVQKDTMIRLMGESSGLIGVTVAFLLGSIAAGPLYAAFPIAGILLKKGSKFSNVLIFIGTWSTTKIPLLLFEASTMGWKFMIIRFIIDMPVIVLIAYIVEKMITCHEKESIYENINMLE